MGVRVGANGRHMYPWEVFGTVVETGVDVQPEPVVAVAEVEAAIEVVPEPEPAWVQVHVDPPAVDEAEAEVDGAAYARGGEAPIPPVAGRPIPRKRRRELNR